MGISPDVSRNGIPSTILLLIFPEIFHGIHPRGNFQKKNNKEISPGMPLGTLLVFPLGVPPLILLEIQSLFCLRIIPLQLAFRSG